VRHCFVLFEKGPLNGCVCVLFVFRIYSAYLQTDPAHAV